MFGPLLVVETAQRSTFPSHAQNTPTSEHFWNLRCRKSARRCGAKHISKSKVSKTDGPRPLLKVEMSKLHAVVAFQVKMLKTPHARTTFWRADVEKSCTLLWREAHFQFRMHKAPDVRTTFDGWDVVLRGRRKGFCTLSKVSKRWRSCSSFNYNYNYNTLHYSRLHYTTLHYTR